MFFAECSTVNQVKKLYHTLCFRYHPDIGGDNRTMQQVNDEYHNKLNGLNGQSFACDDGKDRTYHYRQAVEQGAMDKIAELISLKIKYGTGWVIELIGTWVWVSETARSDKDLLNKNGAKMRWHSKRFMWYWHTTKTYRRKMSNLSTNDMRVMFGSQVYESDSNKAIAIA